MKKLIINMLILLSIGYTYKAFRYIGTNIQVKDKYTIAKKTIKKLEDRNHTLSNKLIRIKKYTGIGSINAKEANLDYTIETFPEKWEEMRISRLVKDHGIKDYVLKDQSMSYPIEISTGYIAFKACEFGAIRGESLHYGFDCSNPYNSSIYSMTGGTVLNVNYDYWGGNFIEVESENKKFFYYHLEEALVNIGDVINQGQLIGVMGDTGKLAQGRHLHLQIEDSDYYYNPFINSTWKNIVEVRVKK